MIYVIYIRRRRSTKNDGDNKSNEKTGDLTKDESKVEADKSVDNEGEIVKSADKQIVNLTEDDSKEKNEKDKEICKSVVKLQKPVLLKRQQYVKGKMSLKACLFVKLKSNKIIKVKCNLQVNVDKTNTEKEEHKYTDAKEEIKRHLSILK